jgi:hypothetical protein
MMGRGKLRTRAGFVTVIVASVVASILTAHPALAGPNAARSVGPGRALG